jgi:hypothetical protein
MNSNRTFLLVLIILALVGLAFFAAYTMGNGSNTSLRDNVRDTTRDAVHDTKDAAKDLGDDIKD